MTPLIQYILKKSKVPDPFDQTVAYIYMYEFFLLDLAIVWIVLT
jgi:hypothetical protein